MIKIWEQHKICRNFDPWKSENLEGDLLRTAKKDEFGRFWEHDKKFGSTCSKRWVVLPIFLSCSQICYHAPKFWSEIKGAWWKFMLSCSNFFVMLQFILSCSQIIYHAPKFSREKTPKHGSMIKKIGAWQKYWSTILILVEKLEHDKNIGARY